jgi:hypothetical protein
MQLAWGWNSRLLIACGTLFSFSQLPSSQLPSPLSHRRRRSASPRPSLDRRNADASTAAPSHHQGDPLGRSAAAIARVRRCLWTENTTASFQYSADSGCLGRRRHWAGSLSSSLLPGVRQHALGIRPHWLPLSIPCPSVSPQTTVCRGGIQPAGQRESPAFSPSRGSSSRVSHVSACAPVQSRALSGGRFPFPGN